MAIISIDDSTNLAEAVGTLKFPVGNDSGTPYHVTLDQIKAYSIDGLQDAIDGKQPLADVLTNTTASFTTAQQTKLAGVESGAQVNKVASVNSKAGSVVLVASDVGLGNVDNTSDANKPISTATQTALDAKAAATHNHVISDVTGLESALDGKQPIAVVLTNTTASFTVALKDKLDAIQEGAEANVNADWNATSGDAQIINKPTLGLLAAKSTVTEDEVEDAALPIAKTNGLQSALDSKLASSLKGSNNGLAELDAGGKVPSSQLPSFVDDVLEYADFASLPATGETGKIYITLDNDKAFRWGGSAYAEISASIALGETSSTAYRGDRGKTAYDHSQLTSGNPHNVSKSDVGLGNVDNTSDVNKPVSTAQQTALDGKAAASHSHVISDVTGLQDALDAKAATSHTHSTADVTGLDTALADKLEADDLLPYETESELDDRDTANRNRANHTGTQAQSTITDLVADLGAKLEESLTINTQTASYTLVLADAARAVEMNNASALDLTVPPNTDVAFPIGTQIVISQIGAGQVTVVAGSGVTIRTAETLKLAKQYAGATLYKRATDEWVLWGNLEASA